MLSPFRAVAFFLKRDVWSSFSRSLKCKLFPTVLFGRHAWTQDKESEGEIRCLEVDHVYVHTYIYMHIYVYIYMHIYRQERMFNDVCTSLGVFFAGKMERAGLDW